MATIKGSVVLVAAGTLIQATIDTNITADSTSGWEIIGFKGWLRSRDATGIEVPESNVIDLILSTQATTITVPSDTEEIARITWALAFSTAAGFEGVELNKSAEMSGGRLTVQPNIYVSGKGSTTIGSITDIYYEIEYAPVKLGAVELLRLLVGGV